MCTCLFCSASCGPEGTRTLLLNQVRESSKLLKLTSLKEILAINSINVNKKTKSGENIDEAQLISPFGSPFY